MKKQKEVTHVGRLSSFLHTHRILRHQARLSVFEDNDAVIKKIIKGWSPDEATRFRQTHRVAPDWFCDRINLGPGMQIKRANTARKTEEIRTKVISGAY